MMLFRRCGWQHSFTDSKKLHGSVVLKRFESSVKSKESSTQANSLISSKQHLYMTHPLSPGSIFFLPHGTRIFNKLVHFMKNQQLKWGFQEVITPLIYKTKLWEESGHWENYKDDMFKVIGNDISKEEIEESDELDPSLHEYGLKPMNCPGHCLIYKKFERSYNELPVRFSDFSSLHRNEASGALSGLTRVRRFHQDDGHIFCELGQINEEIQNTINLLKDTYQVFGIDSSKDVDFYLSTRPPDNFIGDIETWDKAENRLKTVLNHSAGEGKWFIREGDGAFYGPKIDVLITDVYGKKHQVGTIQLDFQLPSRFDLKYKTKYGTQEQPIMIHRAVFGSLERFFAILLDHYRGKWPFWINPRQAVVIPVNEFHIEKAKEIRSKLSGEITKDSEGVAPITGHHFYVDIDSRAETVGSRIKEAVLKGVFYIIMVGDRDIENGTVAVRQRDSKKITNTKVEELYKHFVELERSFK